jgi:hypothetical protein
MIESLNYNRTLRVSVLLLATAAAIPDASPLYTLCPSPFALGIQPGRPSLSPLWSGLPSPFPVISGVPGFPSKNVRSLRSRAAASLLVGGAGIDGSRQIEGGTA